MGLAGMRLEIRQRIWLSPFVFSSVLEVLASALRQEKETKDIYIGKRLLKSSLFTDDISEYKFYEIVQKHNKTNK